MTPNTAAVYDWGVLSRVSAGYLCIIMTMDFDLVCTNGPFNASLKNTVLYTEWISTTNLHQPKPAAGWSLPTFATWVKRMMTLQELWASNPGNFLLFGKVAVGENQSSWESLRLRLRLLTEHGWTWEGHCFGRFLVEETWCCINDCVIFLARPFATRLARPYQQSHVLPPRVEPNHAGCGREQAAVWPRNGAFGSGFCCHTQGEVHGGMPKGNPKWSEQVQHGGVPEWRIQEEGWRNGRHGAEAASHVGGAGIPWWRSGVELCLWVFRSECQMACSWCRIHGTSSAGCGREQAAVWARNGAFGSGDCCHREGQVHGGMPKGSPKSAEWVPHAGEDGWKSRE